MDSQGWAKRTHSSAIAQDYWGKMKLKNKNMNNMKFATAINCIDGRTQMPVIEWMSKEYGVNYVDMITEPGPNKILAENKDNLIIDSIRKKINISVNKDTSKIIAIIGHYDCAGNPVEKDTQLKQIVSAIKTVKSWNLGISVIGLWLDESWQVCKIE